LKKRIKTKKYPKLFKILEILIIIKIIKEAIVEEHENLKRLIFNAKEH